ncbi:MAG: LysM peptidoglycan-binding domain-containing protein [Phycisphaerales bacterium]
MSDRPKLAAIAAAMAILWVVVYWMTPSPTTAVGDGVRITFGNDPALEEPPPNEPATIAVEPAAQPAPALDELERAMARVIPPEFGKYKVQYGDNASTISRKLYGTSQHWQSILKANALTDPSRFREGQTIRYPIDPLNVQGIAVDEAGNRLVDAPPPATRSADTQYVVGRGDTLSGIAKAIYGKATMWQLIRDANRDKVNAEGTNIRPGMVLTIPAPPAGN